MYYRPGNLTKKRMSVHTLYWFSSNLYGFLVFYFVFVRRRTPEQVRFVNVELKRINKTYHWGGGGSV